MRELEITPGIGQNIATRQVGNNHYQKIMGDHLYFEGEGIWGGSASGQELPSPVPTNTKMSSSITLQNAFLEGGTGTIPEVAEIVSFNIITEAKLFDSSNTPATGARVIDNYFEQPNLLGMVYQNSTHNSLSSNSNIDDPAGINAAITLASEDVDNILGILNFQPVLIMPHAVGGLYHYSMMEFSGKFRNYIMTNNRDRDIKIALYAGSQINFGGNWGSQPAQGAKYFYKAVIDRSGF